MFARLLIPVDLTGAFPWKKVVPIALNLVAAFRSELHFVHIVSDFGMSMIEDYLPIHWISDHSKKCENELKEQIAKYVPSDIKANCYIGRGSVYDEVVRYAEEIKADLIILPAIRPELGSYMLGPNASKIARHASISVMVVR